MDSYSQKADHRPRYYKGHVNWLSRSHGFVLLQGQGPVFVHAAQLVQGFSPQDGDPVGLVPFPCPLFSLLSCRSCSTTLKTRAWLDMAALGTQCRYELARYKIARGGPDHLHRGRGPGQGSESSRQQKQSSSRQNSVLRMMFIQLWSIPARLRIRFGASLFGTAV